MKNVMKKAWEIARDGVRKFGGIVTEYFAEALRMAWAIVKKGMETIQLIGSEKQIKWAKDIRKELVEIVDTSKKSIIELAKERGLYERDSEKIEETMAVATSILNNDSAKFYIENFGYAGSKEYVLREMAIKACSEKGLKTIFVRRIGL